MIKNISVILVSSFCLLFSITASAQGIEIFSKDDADAVFSMTKTEWNNNAVTIQQSGGGQLKGESKNGFKLITVNPSGYLAVAPMYETEEEPSFISVTIGYKKELAGLITSEAFNDVLELSKTQLSPS